MADAAVSFAIETLGNILIEEASLLSGVRDQVEEMRTELEWMQCFLKDAEKRKGESDLVRNWVSEIREATYEVEDLIEGFALRSALRNQKGVVNRIKKYAYNHVGDLHQVGSRIKSIKAKLTTLRTRLQTYGIRELKVGGEKVDDHGASTSGRRKRQDYSHIVDHNVVGLDEKITELVELLVPLRGQHDHSVRPVVCLHGMGGVGKTTTAKKVYGDNRIRARFEGFAWVYISQQFNPRQVWESILTQLSNSQVDGKSMSDDELTSRLCGLQKEKRCLLVIDDIWNNRDWVNLSAALPYMDQDSKSKMLLTTRNEGVVSNGVHVYYTKSNVLDHSNSCKLLTDTILFLGGHDHPMKEDLEMKKCVEDMVKQCAGLPLAIVVVGGILATSHDLKKWEKVGDNIKSVLKRGQQEGNEGVMSVLESSYGDLPYNLRSCFLYFSQYREDEEIKTTELKQKWIAEGFVSSSVEEADETMEDIAEVYLLELVSRCMIQVGKRGHTGRIKTCRMHDLMRDMCISKAKEEGFAHTIKLGAENEGANSKKVSPHRLCISSSNHKVANSALSYPLRTSPQLRSIRFQDNLDYEQCKKVGLTVKKLKSVRVLELPSTMGESKHIGNLIHLRFLSLKVSMLPTSIGNLICLQTLKLERCTSYRKFLGSLLWSMKQLRDQHGDFLDGNLSWRQRSLLRYDSFLRIPDSVWRMEKLRHLYLPRDGGCCESEKQQVSDFKNLQTLVNFPPRNLDLEQNLVKFINVRKLVITDRCEEICKIIRGSPGMVFNRLESLSFLNYSNMDLEAVTKSCPNLYRLVVYGKINFPEALSCSTVIWPSKLTKIVLRHSLLDESHMRSLGKLPRLKVLFLYGDSLIGDQMIFHENDFPQLRHLLVEELESLKSWTVFGGLPSLCCLEIVNCGRLESIRDGIQYLKQLKELKVSSMPYVFRKRLERGGEDWDRVKDVPSISFSNCYYPEEDAHYKGSNILDESSSLELLKETILFSGGPDHPIRENSKMNTCAIEMVKICGGVPTAISILGGILARKHEIEVWEGIKSVLKEGEQKGNDVVAGLLELSYADLPCNLKQAFLHFSQYEKDEEIKTSVIIQRWIGEGFLMEDTVGHEHLNELLRRCLIIQVGKRSHRSSGRVTTCSMHEFVWHFCVSKAKEEGFALSLDQRGVGDDEGTYLEKVKFRRLCIYPGGIIPSSLVEIIPQLVSVLFRYQQVLSEYKLNDDEEGEAAMLIVKNLKSVKVLTLPYQIWDLLDESGREWIGNLVDLTFLKLEGLSELPKSFGNLRCLQTLNLEECSGCKIPDWVWGMEQLRHLYLPVWGSVCESSRQQVGDFLNLQTLVNFPPSNFDLEQNLVKISNVRKLVIITEWVGEMGRILRSQDIVFNRLQSLSFNGEVEEVDLEAFRRGSLLCMYRLVVDGSIKFPAAPSCISIWPSNLTKLVLKLTNIDESQLGSLAKVQSLQVLFLQLNAFAGKEMVFHKNDFPQLHHLMIEYLHHLETWAVHEGALPNLLCLEVVCCRKLKSVPDGSQYLKQLKELKVRNMPLGFTDRLERGGEDWDRVSHVLSISISCEL